MYTRCPECETCFRVTDRHLAIAKGKVRCGKCQLVFNALENAIDDLPGNSAATQPQSSNRPQVTTPASVKAEVKTEEMSPAAKLKLARMEAEKEKQRSANVTPSVTASTSSTTNVTAGVSDTSSAVEVKPSAATEDTVVTKTNTAKKEPEEVKAKEAEIKQEEKSPVPPPKVAPPLYKADENKAAAKEKIATDKQNHHDAFHIEDDSFDDEFDLDAAINELTHAAEEVTYDYDSTTIIEEPIKSKPDTVKKDAVQEQEKKKDIESDNVFSTDNYDATSASSVSDILDDVKGQLSLDIETPEQTVTDDYDADDEFQFIELDEEPVKTTEDKPVQAEESNDEFIKNNFDLGDYSEPDKKDEFNLDEFDLDDELDELDEEPEVEKTIQDKEASDESSAEEFIEQFDALDTPSDDTKEEIIISDPGASEDPSIKIGEHSDDYEVPYQLRDDVKQLNAVSGRRLHPALKVSLIVILLVLSFSQLAYFRAHELVNIIPESRSMLESFCENVGCLYSGPRDTKQIELVSRDVRLHPKEKNALLISAAMINNAYYAQPYPNIHIRLSDISGNVVAERTFNPKTYMGKLSNPFLLMRSKTPVHINFEVVDPGKDAVNFEFDFL